MTENRRRGDTRGGFFFVLRRVRRSGRRLGIGRKWSEAERHEIVDVNGEPGLSSWRDGAPDSVTTFELREGRIAAIYVVRNPDKLGALRRFTA